MNRPNDDTSPRARAIMPSNQSVNAAAMKSQNALVGAQGVPRSINQTMANIAGTRETVSQLARVNASQTVEPHARLLATSEMGVR